MTKGYLTTHILDTANGIPASNVRIVLYRHDGDARTKLHETTTNTDGRTDNPILPQTEFALGEYALEFHIGAYFTAKSADLPEPKFLDIIPIRFGISDIDAHYHVPLLASPYSFSTYRGS